MRIAAELLLLGVRVSVYDRNVPEQEELDKKVLSVIRCECEASGLLDLAGLRRPPSAGGPWTMREGEAPRQVRCCSSVQEAVDNADVVFEAVPDDLQIKTDVFVKAVAAAPANVLLATNTLTLPLKGLQRAVYAAVGARLLEAPRIVGLRFLAPVCFVPFCEITLTDEQMRGRDYADLMELLSRLRKTAFKCNVQGAVEDAQSAGSTATSRVKCGFSRIRLDLSAARRRQQVEAKLRRARGPAEITVAHSALDVCCICMDQPPSVTNVLCGHRALCEHCAGELGEGFRKPLCPLCRSSFAPEAKRQVTTL